MRAPATPKCDRVIALVAGEESGDQLGAAIMRSLKARTGGRIRFVGVGGRAMASEGLSSPFDIRDLAIIGFVAIPRRLPLILRRIRETAELVIAAQPETLVIIDSPDFTHRVARRVRAQAPAIPIIDYVPPSVWAWRPGRARAMRRYVDHVLALLPFEPQALQELGGPPSTYVGHPLIERLGELRPSGPEAQRRLSDPPIVLALPGSRGSELRRLSAIFGQALDTLAAGRAPFEIVIPTLPPLKDQVTAAIADWPLNPRIVVDPADRLAAFRTARAALTKSGTVTLELALAGIPMVAAYKVSRFDESVMRLVLRLPSAILVNLILGENVVPEYLQRVCTPPNLAAALAPLLTDTPERRRQLAAFARLDAVMRHDATGASQSPSEHAADVTLRVADAAPGTDGTR